MPNTRFLLTNHAVVNATLLNGTGGGAPALEQSTGFPMTNALTNDRYTLWKTSTAPASPTVFDLDLGQNRSIASASIHGLRVSSLTILSVNIYRSTEANGYPPVDLSSWTSTGSFSTISAPRDIGTSFTAVSARYWRFEFSVSYAGSAFFTLGKLGLGPLSDLGFVYSPGSQETIVRYRTEASTPAGQTVINDFGDTGRLWSLQFDSITGATLTTLQSLAAQSGSFIYVDDAGVYYDVILQGGRLARTRRFNDLYSTTVELQRLP
jgi:hypothetical protein